MAFAWISACKGLFHFEHWAKESSRMLDTLRYTKQLEGVGVSREQAEAHVQILGEMMEKNFATRQDLKDLEHELNSFRQEFKHDMRDLEQRMTIKLGTIVSIAIGVAVALAKLVD